VAGPSGRGSEGTGEVALYPIQYKCADKPIESIMLRHCTAFEGALACNVYEPEPEGQPLGHVPRTLWQHHRPPLVVYSRSGEQTGESGVGRVRRRAGCAFPGDSGQVTSVY
jgi:hypothetical protein